MSCCAHSSATCYFLVETAQVNELGSAAYLYHVLTHIATTGTLQALKALLPRLEILEADKKVS
ncbi:transposase domain-containing protein [Halomonas sp. HAL1]|uniref:transposase domain-containing protein n=1 Tax=Halomonas sp. HAL1 TaxID=550984 RepID=UPI003FCDE63F